MNLIVGDEGIGKGLLTAMLAALITTGRLGDDGPESVAIATMEESREEVLKPRITAAGSDLTKVITVAMESLDLPKKLAHLEASLLQAGVKWVFLDPINEHFSGDKNPQNPKDVATVCGAIMQMAHRINVTVVGILHTNRTESGQRSQSLRPPDPVPPLGSFLVLISLLDDDPNARAIAHDKKNYGTKAPTLKAVIEGRDVTLDDGRVEPFGVLVFGSTISDTVEELLLDGADREAAMKKARKSKTDRQTCVSQITAIWARAGYPKEMDSGAFKRARDDIGIEVDTASEGKGKIHNTWRFPDREN